MFFSLDVRFPETSTALPNPTGNMEASDTSPLRKRTRVLDITAFSDRVARGEFSTVDRGFVPGLNLYIAYKVDDVPQICVISESRFHPLYTPLDEEYTSSPGYPFLWQIVDLRGSFPMRPEYDAPTGVVRNAIPIGVVGFLTRLVDLHNLFETLCGLGRRLNSRGRVLLCVPYFFTGGKRGSVDVTVRAAAVGGREADAEQAGEVTWKVARYRDGLPCVPREHLISAKTLSAWVALARDVVPELDDWIDENHVLGARPPCELVLDFKNDPIVRTRAISDVESDTTTAWHVASLTLERAIASGCTKDVMIARRIAKKLIDKADAFLEDESADREEEEAN
jgi:hypothetical protein